MKRALVSVSALLFALASCKREEPSTSTPSASATVATPVAASASADGGASLEADALPTQEDFEEEVNRTITSKNMEEELDRLEQEIGKSP